MIPALQFRNWQWASLALASPVVVWGALPFHRATWTNLRHGAATMDTLISVGVSAAYVWSLYALFVGEAGMPGMRMDVSLLPAQRRRHRGDLPRGGRRGHGVHPRRPLRRGQGQAPLRRRAAGAARAGRQGRRAASTRPAPSNGSRSRRCRSATGSWSGPARRSRPTGWSRTVRRRSTRRCSPANRCRSRSARATRSSGPRSTPAAGSSCARPGSAPTPSWPRWPASSRTPRPARRRCSGWPTGSRRCSCRW